MLDKTRGSSAAPTRKRGEWFRLPNLSQRTAVMGRTGSGKTQFGAWLLSLSGFDRQPFVVVDYKRDLLLNSIDRMREIGLNEVPKKPGLYIVHPEPDEPEAMEAWLRSIWRRENIGLYFDEAYMLPKKGAFDAILTQGRSKSIPVITLTQRPAWISRFVFSEADYFAVFHLQHRDDRDRVRAFFHEDADLEKRLPQYSAFWHDIGQYHYAIMAPVPEAEEIIETINNRLEIKRRFF